MATCAPSSLIAGGFWNLDDHALEVAIAQLLCQLQSSLGVSSNCNAQQLVAQGSAFWNLPDHDVKTCVAQLLCNINSAASLVPQYNVVAFGADPTGLNDSTAAIQAAINAGGVTYFPAGTYLISATLTNTKRLIMQGVGRANPLGANTPSVAIVSTATNVPVLTVLGNNNIVQGMTLMFKTQQPSGNTNAICLNLTGTSYENTIEDVGYANGAYAIYAGTSFNNNFINNWINSWSNLAVSWGAGTTNSWYNTYVQNNLNTTNQTVAAANCTTTGGGLNVSIVMTTITTDLFVNQQVYLSSSDSTFNGQVFVITSIVGSTISGTLVNAAHAVATAPVTVQTQGQCTGGMYLGGEHAFDNLDIEQIVLINTGNQNLIQCAGSLTIGYLRVENVSYPTNSVNFQLVGGDWINIHIGVFEYVNSGAPAAQTIRCVVQNSNTRNGSAFVNCFNFFGNSWGGSGGALNIGSTGGTHPGVINVGTPPVAATSTKPNTVGTYTGYGNATLVSTSAGAFGSTISLTNGSGTTQLYQDGTSNADMAFIDPSTGLWSFYVTPAGGQVTLWVGDRAGTSGAARPAQIQGETAVGTNQSGSSLYLVPPLGTGNASLPSSAVIIQGGTVQGSGTAVWGTQSLWDFRSVGTLRCDVVGGTISIKGGTNAASGTVTLASGAGTITSTAITTSTVIMLSLKTSSGTPSTYTPNVTCGTGSATVTGLATDNSTYNWVMILANQ